MTHLDDLVRWERFINAQNPTWIKARIINTKTLEVLRRCSTINFYDGYTEERYWKFVRRYAQRLNDEANTGYMLPESEHIERWTDSAYLARIDNSLHHRPTHQAFWIGDRRYTGQVLAFFDLGNNIYQSLLLRYNDSAYNGVLLITFSKTRTQDFYCPQVHLVIQDGTYKK